MTAPSLELPEPATNSGLKNVTPNATTPLFSKDADDALLEEQSSTELRGYLFMALSTIGFSGMSFFTHIAESRQGFSATSAVFVRATIHSVISASFIFCFLNIRERLDRFTPRQWKLLIFRGVAGSLGLVCVFTGLQKLPVGDATAIFFCGPVITMLLSGAILGEPITFLDCFASVMSFSGILLVARPGMQDDTATITTNDKIIGSLVSFGAAWLSAMAYVAVRSLGRGIHFMMSVLSLSLCSILASVAFGGAIGPDGMLANKAGSCTAVLGAIFAFGGQICLNKGLQLCRAGPGVLLRNLDVPLNYILGLVFLGETPSWFSFAGASLIITATFIIGIRQLMQK